ncbi:MAG: efflux RND transporter permease subunit [Planctomycetota bacterium]|jgi:HAE1 family hydrophobic/amphiphilic exporter-1|nr:efflux RND transporter permease subunit [Planctomycetota bacterium]MDP6989617.1 efflux RND transporter permease subunit [Planctomycetota bacterium]
MSARASLFEGAVGRPVTLLVSFAALIVVGVIAYTRIPLEMMPGGFESDGLTVIAWNPGASAEENEAKVVRPLEEHIRTLAAVADVYSWSDQGQARIDVKIERGADMDLARAELRDRIERARPELPDELERVQIWSWNDGDLPLMWFALLHDGQSDRTDYLVEAVVRRRLEAVDGVSRVQIWGRLEDSIRILLDEEKVKAARLDLGALVGRLSRDNFTEPLGEVYDGRRRVLVRSDMRFTSVEEIERYPVGGGLVLADVARVERVKAVVDNLSRIDGDRAYFGQVGQESSANVVETARAVQAAFEELEATEELAGRMEFLVLFSQGDFIEASLGQLRSTALWGGALAALVLLSFLRRVRVTLCVALSIPVSSLLAVAWVYFGGGTFNILTMTGLTLGIGMLVDNSVVVIENIARLHREGRSPREAAAGGVGEVGLAVTLATMTSVVVFLPMIFMTGDPMARMMFGAVGIPLCLSLSFSLLVALIFLPVAAARIVGPRRLATQTVARGLAPLAALPARAVLGACRAVTRTGGVCLRGVHALERTLLRLLTPQRALLALALASLVAWRVLAPGDDALAALRAVGLAPPAAILEPRTLALALAVPVGLLGAALCLFGLPRWRSRPAAAPLSFEIRGEPGTSVVDALVEANARLLDWTLRHRLFASLLAGSAVLSAAVPQGAITFTAFGAEETRSRLTARIELEDNFTLAEASEEIALYESRLAEHAEELGHDHASTSFDRSGGTLTIYWDEPQPPEHIDLVRKRLKQIWPRLPGHRVRYSEAQSIDTRNRSVVTFALEGPDADELARLGREALALLEEVDGLEDVTSPLGSAPEQVRVDLDSEQAWRLGVSAELALMNISWALRGAALPFFQEPGRELPFYIEYDEEEVAGLDTLRDLDIQTLSGAVPLASFASLRFQPGARSIFRRNGKASFAIQGRVSDPTRQAEVSAAGLAALRRLDLPRGFEIARDDSVRSRTTTELGQMQRALALSVVLVFLLMSILFESLLRPFSVLFTIPFAATGALWTLYLTRTPMDSVGFIGLIILVGVVVNNGIVLIDRIHRLREGGMERRLAVLEGSRTRVRPIVMTAMTTIFGLLPMALAEPPAEGVDYRALATCVAGGLAISTFFTLWVVPLAFTLLDDLGLVLAERGRRAVARLAGLLPASAGAEEV